MTCISGRGFAELQILKKWNWPYLLNWVEYCNEILNTHWYWQDVAQVIVKCHLGLAEVLPMFKFWKKVKLVLSLEPFGQNQGQDSLLVKRQNDNHSPGMV